MHWATQHFCLSHFGRQMSHRPAAFFPIEIIYEGILHFATIVEGTLKLEEVVWRSLDLSPKIPEPK